jgi:hypothetical protein
MKERKKVHEIILYLKIVGSELCMQLNDFTAILTYAFPTLSTPDIISIICIGPYTDYNLGLTDLPDIIVGKESKPSVKSGADSPSLSSNL